MKRIVDRAAEPLWNRYVIDHNPAIKTELLEHYYILVRKVAGSMRNKFPVEYEEMVSWGVFGLNRAIEHYDLDRKVKFETYAISAIRGAILDELRALDRVPRSVRRKRKLIDEAYTLIESRNGGVASMEEVAMHLDIPKEQVEYIEHQTNMSKHQSLDELDALGYYFKGDTLSVDSDSMTPSLALDKTALADLIEERLQTFSYRDQAIILLYYYEGLTFEETAKALGISDTYVSGRHSAVITDLREYVCERYEL